MTYLRKYPRKGMLCLIHYSEKYRKVVDKRWIDAIGRIVCVGKGPGPRNALVKVYGIGMVVVPIGNLRIYD